ncbi:MAG: helix-turn-helix transcriptional regulator [Chloroflexi bacterium]|nr:helix-turn-helix transcriptional regulator [Chloroflexota bacterium]
MKQESFAEVLRFLLNDHGWTSAQLAEHLSVDSSLVRRWLSGLRTPGIGSDHLEKVSEALGLDDTEVQRLRAAQLHSLAEKQRRPAPKIPATIPNLLNATPAALGAYKRYRLPSRDGARNGPAAFEGGMALIDRAIELGIEETSGCILLTFQGENDLFAHLSPGARKDWRRILQSAVRSGFHIKHLLRLDKDVNRSAELVSQMLDLLGYRGTYRPFYFPRYGFLDVPYDLLVIPRLGALTFYATTHDSRSDAAILTKNPSEVELIQAHFAQLESHAKLLLRAYSSNVTGERLQFDSKLTDAEVRPGERYLLKNGLSSLTRPASTYSVGSPWWERYELGYHAGKDLPVDVLAKHRLKRLESFRKQIGSHLFRDLCPLDAIERLASSGSAPPDEDEVTVGRAPSTVQALREAFERLTTVLAMLDYPKYELGLFESEHLLDRSHTSITRSFWEIKNDNVFIETFPKNNDGTTTEFDLVLTEPTIADGFKSFHTRLWEGVAPKWQDKRHIRRYLQAKIAEVSARLTDLGDLSEAST